MQAENVIVNVIRQIFPEAREKFPDLKLIFEYVLYENLRRTVKIPRT